MSEEDELDAIRRMMYSNKRKEVSTEPPKPYQVRNGMRLSNAHIQEFTIDGKLHKFPSMDYVKTLEDEIRNLRNDLKRCINTINRMVNQHNTLLNTVKNHNSLLEKVRNTRY